jgi:N-acetylmuramoyl-L-alanine amidase
MRAINEVIIHCSATPAGRDVSAADIRDWHTTPPRNWSDIGYHFVVRLDGTIELGRLESVVGAHSYGQNRTSIGVCYIGGTNEDGDAEDTRTVQQRIALRQLIEDIVRRYPGAEVFGHCDFSTKACPSFDARSEYQDITGG